MGRKKCLILLFTIILVIAILFILQNGVKEKKLTHYSKNFTIENDFKSNKKIPKDKLSSFTKLQETQWCNRVPGFITPPGLKVALASYPGSGNTWVRYLLQQLTGALTGSVYFDPKLVENGFPAEGVSDGRVIAVKTHFHDIHTLTRYDKVILIVRNPWDAILSFFHYVTQKSHTNTAKRPIIKGKFDQFAEKQLSKWLEFNLKWLAHYSVFQSFLEMLRCYFSTNSMVKPYFKYRDGRLRGAFSDAQLIRLIMIIKLTVLILSQSSALIILEDGKTSNFFISFLK